MFGDVRFEDDIKNAKEIERRQWLEDLQKQIEENKRKKFLPAETERRKDFLHENVQPLIQEAANRHNPQFKQGQDVARNIGNIDVNSNYSEFTLTFDDCIFYLNENFVV